MKRITTFLLALLATITFANAATISRVLIGDLYYNLNTDNNTAEVTYKSKESLGDYNMNWSITTANIPSIVNYDDVDYTVTAIGNYSFFNCYYLNSVSIPNTVTRIGYMAFYNCFGINNIVLPNGLTQIGEHAFEKCSFLSSINLPAGITSIAKSVFSGCYCLTSIDLPSGLASIGESAFSGCSRLTSITLPSGLTTLESNAFGGCSNLTSITIPSSVNSIGSSMFSGCTKLSSIVVDSDNTICCSIDGVLFNKDQTILYTYPAAKAGDEYIIPNTVTSIESYAFSSCQYLETINIPNQITYLNDGVFSSSNIVSIILPSNLTSIGKYVFTKCSKLKTIDLPDGIISIGEGAFSEAAIESITLPAGLTSLNKNVFSKCSKLKTITLPNGLISTEMYALSGTAIETIDIPQGVTSIGARCFHDCTKLKSITCHAINPPTVGTYAFTNVNKSIPVFVPNESLQSYKTKSGWKDFTDIRPIEYPIMVKFVDWDNTVLSSVFVAKNTSATPPEDPIRDGYTFTGWDLDFTNVTSDLTITALYEPIEYFTVRFIDFDGTILSEQSITKGLPATPPTNPTREGYTFIGWDKEFTSITENVDINAVYQINTYLVRFFDWDGQLLKQQNVEYKSAATPPTYIPVREGYTFNGWDLDYSSITAPLDITAQYLLNYFVHFIDWDGASIGKQEIPEGYAAETPADPVRDGYNFVGWSSPFDNITKETYCVALYDKIGGTVTYLSEAGDVIATENVDLHLPAAPIIAGKSFKGWLTESADSENGIVLRATYTSDNPTTSEDVTVTPSSTSADVSFPFITGALTYELVIRDLSGNVVCKIMFSATGQLLGIAFAPSRNRNQQATQSTGFNFTVEGLNASTTYNYEFVAYDDTDDAIETLSGSFTTTADTPTNIDNASAANAPQKYIQDGHLFIDNNNSTFDARGQQMR